MAKKRKLKNVNAGGASYFDGGLLGLIGTTILMLFALLIPLLPAGGLAVLGFTLFDILSIEIVNAIYAAICALAFFMLFLGLAWSSVIALRWQYRHTVIGGKRLVFKGKKTALWGNFLKWLFLTVITLLIYGLWVGIKMQKWVIKNVETVEEMEAENEGQDAMNAYLPMPNPYFPTYPTYPTYPPYPPVPNAPQIPNVPQGQMPTVYFPPYPYFPSFAPCPYTDGQCKKEK